MSTRMFQCAHCDAAYGPQDTRCATCGAYEARSVIVSNRKPLRMSEERLQELRDEAREEDRQERARRYRER